MSISENSTLEKMKMCYLHAVKSVLILKNGLLPEDLDKVIATYMV